MLLFLIASIINYGSVHSVQELGKDPKSSGLDSRELYFFGDKESDQI